MRIRGIGRVRRAARWVRNRFERRALVLLYHRVAELPYDPNLLCVTPQHFAEHLEILRKHSNLMRLQQLVQALQNGNLSRRGVVVTFDDGYADNLCNAKRLLERYDIPATVFVTTGYIGHEREFWWDKLGRLLLQPGTLPETLCLSLSGSTRQWELGQAAHYSKDHYHRYQRWNVTDRDVPSPRQRLYLSLRQLLRALAEEERRDVLDELQAWAGAESVVRPTHRALSPGEVFHLAEGKLVEIGAHTVTHSVLSTLPADAQQAEIQRSKACLEGILGHPVTSFSYPHGTRSDYTAETVAFVREAGFACACSNFPGLVRRGTDLFQLPRIRVFDWNGEEFARRLEERFRD